MNRTKARELAMQILYQIEARKDFSREFADSAYIKIAEIQEEAPAAEYIQKLLCSFLEHRDMIDKLIENASENWKIGRFAKTDLAVLRTAVTEIYYIEDMPIPKVVNASVDLAKSFGTEKSGRFVNGILRTIARNKHEDGAV